MGRCFLGLVAGTALALGVTAVVSPVQAAGRVLRQAASGNVSELRLAHAASSEASRLWVQYRLSGSGRVAIVTPVAPGTFVDASPDAWFEALEEATAPRVVPPAGIPNACGGSKKVHMTGALSHPPTLAPSTVAVLSSVEAVEQFALSNGLPFYTADEQALIAYQPPFVGLVYQLAGGNALTEAVRYTTIGSPAPIALELAQSTSAADVTFWTISTGRAQIADSEELTPDAIGFSWLVSQATSDYPARRRELLENEAGSWLVETTGHAPLFQPAALPIGGVIPPVVNDYFERTNESSDACLDAVLDAYDLGKSGATIAEACPKGSLAIVPLSLGGLPSCDPAPGAGEIAAQNLVCGSADDLAHAFSGRALNNARITRHRHVLSPLTIDPVVKLFDGTALPRILTAPELDFQQCKAGGFGGGTSGGQGGSAAYSGSSGYSGSGGGWQEDPDPDYVHTDVDVSCSGSGSGDGCSGDSSSSSDDDSCSGDSSSSSDDSCSGDSSSGDDACSGDSSGSDGACSGDSGGGGDGCSGDAGGGDCSVAARGARRLKLSIWLMLAAALALPFRRLTKRSRAAER